MTFTAVSENDASVEEPPALPAPWDAIVPVLQEVGWRALQVAIIVVAALLIAIILRAVIRRVVDRIVSGAKNRARVDDTQALERSPVAQVRVVQRTRTLGSILQNIVGVTIIIVALLLIVSVINPDILGSLTLLTAAIGAGLGFGAQNIVKDVLNGIFIVAEDQVGIGDVVDVGLATGIVEYVSVRVTHVRDVNGTLWYVRNGEITRIGNLSQGWSRIIVDVGVPVDSDVDEVEHALQDAAAGLAKDPKWRSRIVDRPEVWGLEAVTGETLVLRVVIRTRAHSKDDVAKEPACAREAGDRRPGTGRHHLLGAARGPRRRTPRTRRESAQDEAHPGADRDGAACLAPEAAPPPVAGEPAAAGHDTAPRPHDRPRCGRVDWRSAPRRAPPAEGVPSR
ncbi:mechanosensitive ion channel family protein [Microbacterium albipurpureum]|uniref:mechanosensitive ion channel family protein n=1 Tax=Microbacterium albipurpureum TaxID=3050384 RepID=UPI003BF4FEA5